MTQRVKAELIASIAIATLRDFHEKGHYVYWASEASPTLGCSIEISRDIYMYVGMSVCLSYVKLTA